MEDGVKFCPSCGTRAAGGGDAGGTAPAPKPATEKIGNIIKCPSCGAPVPAMTAVCPDCGHEFRNAQVGGEIKAFFAQVGKLQESDNRDNGDRVKNFVVGYPIPGTKEDLLEFILFCSAHISFLSGGGIDGSSYYWVDKCFQTYQKAETVLSSDKEFLSKIAKILTDKQIPKNAQELEALRLKVETAAQKREKERKVVEHAAKKERKADERKRDIKAFLKTDGGRATVLFSVIALVMVFSFMGMGIIPTPAQIFRNMFGSVQGIGVELPESAVIPVSQVSIYGSLESYLSPTGAGVTMKPDNDGKRLHINMELTARQSFAAALEKTIAAKKKEAGIKDGDKVKVYLETDQDGTLTKDYYKTQIKIGSFSIGPLASSEIKVDKAELGAFLKSLTKIEKGSVKTVSIALPMTKKQMTALMASETFEITVVPSYTLEYGLLGIEKLHFTVE
jgi:hypothetical protein